MEDTLKVITPLPSNSKARCKVIRTRSYALQPTEIAQTSLLTSLVHLLLTETTLSAPTNLSLTQPQPFSCSPHGMACVFSLQGDNC